MAKKMPRTAHVLQLLTQLRHAIEELTSDADAAEAIRAMFAGGSARSNGKAAPAQQALPDGAASENASKPKAKKKRKYKTRKNAKVAKAITAKTAAPVKRAPRGEVGAKILEFVAKAQGEGVGAREIGTVLALEPNVVSYNLNKLLLDKKLHKQGKTSKTVYLSNGA